MARITIVLALTAALFGMSGTGSLAQSGPPNYSKDQLMSMCRARLRSTIPRCECVLKTMHKHLTKELINIYFWASYDDPSAAKAYIAALQKKDPQRNRKTYWAHYPAWIETQKTCAWL